MADLWLCSTSSARLAVWAPSAMAVPAAPGAMGTVRTALLFLQIYARGSVQVVLLIGSLKVVADFPLQ